MLSMISDGSLSPCIRGEPLTDAIPRRPDLILAADCVYYEPTFPLLVQTLSDLVNDEKTEVLFCYKRRRKVEHFSSIWSADADLLGRQTILHLVEKEIHMG
jgi:hypothetical protein